MNEVQPNGGYDPESNLLSDLPIVVGVDGSEQSLGALQWAVGEARRRRTSVRAVTAYSTPLFAMSGMDANYAALDESPIRSGAQAVLAQAVESVEHDDVEIETAIGAGDAAGLLIDESAHAALVVVGSRGRGGFVGRLLGSVSGAIPGHTHCPTVTVPPADKRAEVVEDVVVAAVDGSEQARAAVLVAAEEARSYGMPLRLLSALPSIAASMAWVPAPIDHEASRRQLEEQMHAGSAWLRSHMPDVPLEVSIVEGQPVEVITKATASATLTVLGSRGRGGFTGMLLGSTTSGVQAHTRGPVMVVPDREDPRLADRASFGSLPG